MLEEKLEKRDHLEDPGFGRWIIFRWIFRKGDVEVWTGKSWLTVWTDGGYL